MLKKLIKKAVGFVVATAMLCTMTIPQGNTVYAATDPYQDRFMEMWTKIHDPANGYFSSLGIPYHSVETLMCEAPDYGHETTSEAFSYYMWLEAMYGKFTGDFSKFEKAWETTEKYMIPTEPDQPNTSMSKYSPGKPATYAPEWELPDKYPSKLDSSAPVGSDPIHNELVSTYGTSTIYGMHWLLDVDNWYGFGSRGDGITKPSYFNTFQRGEQESVWETIPQPCWDDMKFGGKNGYLDLFTGDSTYAKQFKYTNAPDADARAVQATYNASLWAKEYGKDISTYVGKAAKMGDYLRYAMFDKYFRKIGSPSTAGAGYDAAHYLLSWYYAWGGAQDGTWSWKIGCSHNHFGYQNPLAAWVLSTNQDFKPKSQNGASDWAKSLSKQLDFYQWLQSSEGAIAGGASNSNNGRYEAWPSGTATFDGMGYLENPVYHDPGSNTWFGFQAWSMQRVAEYYYRTKDAKAKKLMDKWVTWVKSEIKLNADGTFAIPATIDWTGQPDTWNGTYTGNPNLHVSVVNYGTDLGITGSLANTLLYYSAASGDNESRVIAKELLDRTWTLYKDSKGVSAPEPRADYKRFLDPVYVPAGWTGTMPNGDAIKPGVKFIDIRSKYKNDPDWAKVEAAINAGTAPTFNYHRFWAQCDVAIANGLYSILFGTPAATISPTTASFDKKASNQADVVVTMTPNGNTFNGIKNGSTVLTSGTDYTVSGNTVTILKGYLAKQPVGTTNLIFDFNAGTDPILAVTISDTTPGATISPTSATFDKNTSNQTNVVVTMTPNGNTLNNIKNGSTVLTSGTDYTVSGNTVTILKGYLAKQPIGTTVLTFDFSAGTDPVLTVTVKDSSIPEGNMKVQFYNSNTAAQNNTLYLKFNLQNTGTTAIDLSKVKMRYYYTINGEKAQNFWCDWSSAGTQNVTGTFTKLAAPKTNADYYVEIGFTSGAGSLAAGQSVEVQARVAKSDWSNYTQTDDYSFNSSSTSYVEWNKVTGYLSGSLLWGIEP